MSSSSHTHSMDVSHLAHLARIAITSEEATLFTSQFDRILEHVEQINKLDVSGIEPMAHAISVFDIVREDLPSKGLAKNIILQNAPHAGNGLFMVPKVLD